MLETIVLRRVTECRERLEKAKAAGQVHPCAHEQVDDVLALLTTGVPTPRRPRDHQRHAAS